MKSWVICTGLRKTQAAQRNGITFHITRFSRVPAVQHALSFFFDGPCLSSNRPSLNDTLLVGPTIKQDLYSIVLRFRIYQIAFTADITKMYRQVRIHQDDRRLQRILWRRSAEEPLRTYELSTVTYGTASAPYLVTRCLQQLAEDESKDFSLAPEQLTNNFYVDDALCGANTIENALRLQQEFIALLGGGGFHLRKFCASHPITLETVPPDYREMEVPIELDSNEGIKHWVCYGIHYEISS